LSTPRDSDAANTEEKAGEEEESGYINEPVLKIDDARYAFSDAKGTVLEESSECVISLGTQLLTIESSNGDRKEFGYREITSIDRSDYSAKLSLEGFMFELSSLGEKYDDFMRLLLVLRNDQYVDDLLIDEGKPTLSVRGRIALIAANNGEPSVDEGEIRVYKTRLGIFQDSGKRMEVARLSEITSSKFQDYTAEFSIMEQGPKGRQWKVTISLLGENYEGFVKAFQGANRQLQGEVSSLIREICPTISFTSALTLSKVMVDGGAVRLDEIRRIAPDFAKSFEAQIGTEGEDMYRSIDYLLSLEETSGSLVGVKKIVSNYLYLLVPIKERQVVAFGSNEKGHATYFFRASPEETMSIVVSGLRDANFRREPIYLADKDLLRPHYARYNHALKKLGSLRELRSRFLGRAIHADYETWKSQTEAIISK